MRSRGTPSSEACLRKPPTHRVYQSTKSTAGRAHRIDALVSRHALGPPPAPRTDLLGQGRRIDALVPRHALGPLPAPRIDLLGQGRRALEYPGTGTTAIAVIHEQ